jgi:hypothetical protein
MAPGADRHDEGSSVTAIQLSPRRRRAVRGTWPRRSTERGSLIGYSYRKPGDYKFSQVWYERALKADPNHVRGSITACGKLSRATAIKCKKMQKGPASLPGLSFSFER